MVQRGLVGGDSLLTCQRWEREGIPLQCYRCSGYGHKAPRCPNGLRCGTCSGEHDSRDHKPEDKGVKCPVYNGAHTAWDMQCARRSREFQRVRQRLQTKATLYDTTGLRTPRKTAEEKKDSEGFTVMEKPQRRRRLMRSNRTKQYRPGLGAGGRDSRERRTASRRS